jgi:hypothetical protein
MELAILSTMKANIKLQLEALNLAEKIRAKYPQAAQALELAAERFVSDLKDDSRLELVTVHDKDGELVQREIYDLQRETQELGEKLFSLRNSSNKSPSTV